MPRISEVLLAVSAAACIASASMAQANAEPADEPQSPVGSQAAPASPTAAIGQSDNAAARTIFEINCSSCHDITDVTSQRKDFAGWEATVQRMVAYGAPVAEEDQKQIIDYLAENYSPSRP